MRFPAHQIAVAEFVKAAGIETTVPARTLDLTSEVGELAKEVLKATDYGRKPFTTPDAWADELGDAFFALACLANSTGVNLEEALDAALEKYRERLRLKADAGSGR